MPSFFNAEIGITGTPNIASILLISIEPPLPLNSSIMLRAITIGTCISRSWTVKYKFLSMFVASTMLIMALGFSFKIKCLEIISSPLYGDIE